jgi:Zn finger protein HypA/HybF involved in hydrogenase expression
MKRARCNRCNTVVRKETHKGLREVYPFYCPCCDENMFRFETHKEKKNMFSFDGER